MCAGASRFLHPFRSRGLATHFLRRKFDLSAYVAVRVFVHRMHWAAANAGSSAATGRWMGGGYGVKSSSVQAFQLKWIKKTIVALIKQIKFNYSRFFRPMFIM